MPALQDVAGSGWAGLRRRFVYNAEAGGVSEAQAGDAPLFLHRPEKNVQREAWQSTYCLYLQSEVQ